MTDKLVLENINKGFAGKTILNGIDLTVGEDEFVVFVGPSGCGKSTLLRIISGLEQQDGGRIMIGGKDVTRREPAERGVAMVFQNYALYPHMTVASNMDFGLRIKRVSRKERRKKVQDAANLLRIGDLLERTPSQLSGGQKQRVAIGRAIVREPVLFLFDEPLSNLDAELRVEMRKEIILLRQRLGTPMIYVTHDQTEAMTMADRIVVLNRGIIQQVGTPDEIYRRPKNVFVAGFVGNPKINLFEGVAAAGPNGPVVMPADGPAGQTPLAVLDYGVTGRLTVGVRPEAIRFGAPGGDGLAFEGVVELTENLGNVHNIFVEVPALGSVALTSPDHVRPGSRLGIGWDLAAALVFNADGEALGNAAEKVAS